MPTSMVAGGTEATVSPLGVGGLPRCARCPRATTIPPTASRPWDKDRDGFVLGEGAGVVVLEEYEHAKARGAKIYAELVGYGMSADAGHITAPNTDGPRRAMRAALRNAALDADAGAVPQRAWHLHAAGRRERNAMRSSWPSAITRRRWWSAPPSR